MKNVGNFNELKWMPKYTADGTYRGRKKMICGSGATFQVMEFCNGHPVHRVRTQPAHHDIVQQADKIGNGVLHQNGQGYGQHHPVKRLIPKPSFPQRQVIPSLS